MDLVRSLTAQSVPYTTLSDEEFAVPQPSDSNGDVDSNFTPTKSTLLPSVAKILFYLLPSFVQNRVRKSRTPRTIHKTSFLDGLRGLAALIVFFYHTVRDGHAWMMPAYGVQEMFNFMQLPFLRIFLSGPAMVHIFFVISGYVLSCKQVRLVRAGDFEKLSDSLFSSIFRRGFRLFLPSIAGLALLEALRSLGMHPGLTPGFARRLGELVSLWRWDYPEYDLKFLWTIPIEASGSMLLFLVILGLSRARLLVRIGSLGVLMVHSLAAGHWAPCEFLGGILMAEVEAALEGSGSKMGNEKSGSSSITKSAAHLLPWVNMIFWGSAFLLGIFLAGWSGEDSGNVPVLGSYFHLTPQAYLGYGIGNDVALCFWFVFASILITWSLLRLPVLQRVFVTSPIQYLGDISYSLYIIHGCFPGTTRKWIAESCWTLMGTPEQHSFMGLIAIALELLIIGSINICVSDLFMRLIDHRSVQFARWVERVCRDNTV